MIQDAVLMTAVSRILQRAERQIDIGKLVETFVDVGLSTQIQNNNNQIIYGRRGTGKTHVFRVVADSLSKDVKNIVCYTDMRTLGSSSQYTDPQVPIQDRCRLLFSDFIKQISNALLEYIAMNVKEGLEKILQSLSELSMIPAEGRRAHHAEEVVEKSVSQSGSSASVQAGISMTTGIGLSGRAEAKREQGIELQRTFTKVREEGVVFPDLKSKVEEILNATSSTLYIFMDEWSSVPVDVQPYFAELLKRSFLPMPRVVIKIAALEYRSKFSAELEGQRYGFEVGADVATTIDIDDYYVFDRNPEAITDVFANILYRHLTSELEADYLQTKHSIASPNALIAKMFTDRSVFREIVRAAEGVIRDLINIFSTAYFDSQRRSRDSIDRKSVLEAARQWFEKDKSNNLTEHLQNVLERIITDVIGARKARSFLLPRELERNADVQQLFDFRIIHLVKRGYADKENPGLRYNIYTLDYGTYVDLLNTSKQPDLEMSEMKKEHKDLIVPFDDKRSIRRIILKESDLTPRGVT